MRHAGTRFLLEVVDDKAYARAAALISSSDFLGAGSEGLISLELLVAATFVTFVVEDISLSRESLSPTDCPRVVSSTCLSPIL